MNRKWRGLKDKVEECKEDIDESFMENYIYSMKKRINEAIKNTWKNIMH